MAEDLQRFFKSIKYKYNENDFQNSKILKVVLKEKDESFDIYINSITPYKINLINDILECAKKGINGENKTNIIFNYETITNDDIYNAYIDLFKLLIIDRPLLCGLSTDDIKYENNVMNIAVSTKHELEELTKENKKINKKLKTYGYPTIEFNIYIDELRHEEIKKTIETPINNNIKKEPKSIIMGSKINKKITDIKLITSQENDVTVKAYVFNKEFVEREKISYITLKISDNTDSLLAKIKMFGSSKPMCASINEQIEVGKWYLMNGAVSYDDFAKDLVLSINNMEYIKVDKIIKKDEEQEKRVELHAHTMMSQMDGVSKVGKHSIDIVNKAIEYGHKAIAITDHNGCQAFPQAFETVNKFNKNKEEKDKFKVLYGTELVMIEEDPYIVKNPTNDILSDLTYVVFDVETTGFNAGLNDSMIEIGAVKIKDGEVIEKFDELINPGHKLSDTIIEVTHITDSMLNDKDNEENVTKRFKEWIQDLPLIAHNAKFDISFLKSAYYKYNLGTLKNTVIDTLTLSRALDKDSSKHSLSALVKKYNIDFDENAHHRADYDSLGTGYIFTKMLQRLDKLNIKTLNDINTLITDNTKYHFVPEYHINIIATSSVGLKNMFKLISYANTLYLDKTPRIPRSIINEHREGLLISSSCYKSEIFSLSLTMKNEEELSERIKFYDYIEVQPPSIYSHLVLTHDINNVNEVEYAINKIIRCSQNANVLVTATGDVHQTNKEDTIYREIIVNQKVPGGKFHPLSRVLKNYRKIPDQYFMTTKEMLDEFKFLNNEKLIKEIVITNTNKIADMCEIIEIIIDTKGIPFSPKIPNSEITVKELVYNKAHSIYGEKLPELIETRTEKELNAIIKGGFDVIYLIAQKLVKKSNEDGYIVGSRGSVGSSLVAYFMGISEVNPLGPHYVCSKCHNSIFELNGELLSKTYACGFDLPDMVCPLCNTPLKKDGQDIPFETFLGFDLDKVPDIDLNFSGVYQWKAHEYTKELFGIDNVYRAGTVTTVADKVAYGFVKGFFEDQGILNKRGVEIERLAEGCTGVKRTTGQHPGGIVVVPSYMDVYDFTPYQFPAEDNTALWRTTHFEYHAIDQQLLKLDILGHDDPTSLRMLQDYSHFDLNEIPMDDHDTMQLFSSPEVLGVTSEDISCETGALAIPEFGTKFVMGMLQEIRPKTFGELIKIAGLSHGTDVWLGNAQELIKNNIVQFKDVIGCRDDIMVYLMYQGLEPKRAFKIMEFVRKGKPSVDKTTWEEFVNEMKKAGIANWFIDSCSKIKYMFPKAHAAAYVTSAFKIAYFKVHYPIWFYSTYFSIRVADFDVLSMIKGKEAIRNKINELVLKGKEATNKELNVIDTLRVALEMTARGFKFRPIDLEKSDGHIFVIADDNKSLYLPFSALDGLGENVANSIIKEREKGPFVSIEDFQTRCKVNGTQIEKLKALKVLDNLPESSQLSLF